MSSGLSGGCLSEVSLRKPWSILAPSSACSKSSGGGTQQPGTRKADTAMAAATKPESLNASNPCSLTYSADNSVEGMLKASELLRQCSSRRKVRMADLSTIAFSLLFILHNKGTSVHWDRKFPHFQDATSNANFCCFPPLNTSLVSCLLGALWNMQIWL